MAEQSQGRLGKGMLVEGLHWVGAVLTSPYRFVRWLAEWIEFWGASRRRRILGLLLIALLVIGGLGSRLARLDLRFDQAEVARAQTAETYYIPPHWALRAMSLGHETFLADVLFLRANLYFITHLVGDRMFEWLGNYTDAILALDPENQRVYEWASQSTKYGQSISREALERSNAYSERGIEHFPDHWRFYFDIGFNYLIEWPHEDDAERKAMRQKALPYFEMAAALPGSEIDPNFLAELHLKDSDVEMALFHAYLRYWESSEEERASLRGRITRFESVAAARKLAEVEARWKGQYPFIAVGLFEMLGPDDLGVPPRDWTQIDSGRHL